MIINIFYIYLMALYFISSSFFGVLSLPFSIHDGILLISLLVIFTYISSLYKNIIYEDRHFHLFFVYSFFMSAIMAYINFGQPLTYGLRASRILLIFSILIVALNIMLKNFQIKKAHMFMLFISFLIMFINIYVYATGDTSMLVDGIGVLKRLGEIRVIIGTFTSIVFVLYFYYALKEHKWMIIPLVGLLFTMIVIAKTRSVIFPILIILLIPLLRAHKAQVFKIWMVFGIIVVVSFMISGYEKSILSPIIDLVNLLIEESQTTKHSNVNVRGLELAYFLNFLDTKSFILGYGMENKLFIEQYTKHFFLEDIGLFKILYLHGVVGLLMYIAMLWRLYVVSKVSDSALHMTGRSIVYFQILSPSSVFLYVPEYMLLVFIVYILIKNENKRISMIE